MFVRRRPTALSWPAASITTSAPALTLAVTLALTACGPASDDPAKDTGTQRPVFDTQNGDAPAPDVATTDAPADAAPAPDVAATDDTSGTTSPDTAGAFDVWFPQIDGTCTPQCSGKACGADGCGSVCGFCPSGQVCAADGSACHVFCKPDCSAKKCGDNGCGGSCGDCPSDHTCGVDFLCHKKDCVGTCALPGGGKKVCGGDGCGGSCGLCAAGDVCADSTGACSPTACKGIPAVNSCAGSLLIACDGTGAAAKKLVTDCEAQQPQKVCAYDTLAGKYGCVDKPPCTAQCKDKSGDPKECGADGCGGTCGSGCAKGWACPGGTCQAKAGATCGQQFPLPGQCEGDSWLFCSSGIIQALDCSKAGQTCGWIATANPKTFGCQ